MEIKLFSGTDMFSVRDYLRDKIREEINREKEYETNDSFIVFLDGSVMDVRTDNFGGVPAENTG